MSSGCPELDLLGMDSVGSENPIRLVEAATGRAWMVRRVGDDLAAQFGHLVAEHDRFDGQITVLPPSPTEQLEVSVKTT
jgi:hypothetical protein